MDSTKVLYLLILLSYLFFGGFSVSNQKKMWEKKRCIFPRVGNKVTRTGRSGLTSNRSRDRRVIEQGGVHTLSNFLSFYSLFLFIAMHLSHLQRSFCSRSGSLFFFYFFLFYCETDAHVPMLQKKIISILDFFLCLFREGYPSSILIRAQLSPGFLSCLSHLQSLYVFCSSLSRAPSLLVFDKQEGTIHA